MPSRNSSATTPRKIAGSADVVDVWLDRQFAGEARATAGGFTFELDLADVAIGEHQLLLAADGASFAFAEVKFHKSHPLYVVVSNDWDDPDNADPMLERQERLHARHPALRAALKGARQAAAETRADAGTPSYRTS